MGLGLGIRDRGGAHLASRDDRRVARQLVVELAVLLLGVGLGLGLGNSQSPALHTRRVRAVGQGCRARARVRARVRVRARARVGLTRFHHGLVVACIRTGLG